MIKTLILLHLWSCIVAWGAWALQRDKENEIGRQFFGTGIWLGLIALCFTPSVISSLPLTSPFNASAIEVFNAINKIPSKQSLISVPTFNYGLIYFTLCGALMGRTLWGWLKLQLITTKVTGLADVYITQERLPPLTLSWPRRAIILPEGLEGEDALIAHERCHLRHWDAELTLVVLLLRDFMLRGPGVSYLVRQWRLAIELRADRAATEMLTAAKRQDYAVLLLQGLKPSCDHAGGGALPCPTAHLTSTHYRSVKMRLNQIMQPKAVRRKRRGYATLGLTAFSAAIIGLMSQGVAAETHTEEQDVTFLKRIPPVMPKSCPGLDLNTIEITGRELKVGGQPTYQHTAEVGRVILKFDVTKNGRTENIRIVKSNHPCFEPFAKDSVAQWLAEPSETKINDTGVMIKFLLTGENHEDIEGPLNAFLGGEQ